MSIQLGKYSNQAKELVEEDDKSPLNPNKDSSKDFFQIKSNSKLRWAILALMGIGEFIFLYILNICQGIQKPLQQGSNGIQLTSVEFNLLAALANYPNIFILLFTGTFIDRYDKNKILVALSLVFCIAQLVFTIGIGVGSYGIMVVGRLIFGFIGQTLFIILMKNVALWFSKVEYGLAIGIFTSVGRLGLSIGGIVTPYVYASFDSLVAPNIIGFALTCLCLLASIAAVLIERYMKKLHNVVDIPKQYETMSVMTFIKGFKFNELYWYNNLSLFLGYSSIWGFIFNGNDLLCSIFHISIKESGNVNSMLFIFYIIFAIITGYILKINKKLYTISSIFSVFIGLASYLALIYFPEDTSVFTLVVPVAGLGAYYGIYNVCEIALINLLIDESNLAKSFGMTWSIIALSQSVPPMLLGEIKDQTKGYFWVIIFLLLLAVSQIIPLGILGIKLKEKMKTFY